MNILNLYNKSIGLLGKIARGEISPLTVARNLKKKISNKIKEEYKKLFEDKYIKFSMNKKTIISNYLNNPISSDIKLLFDKVDIKGKKGIVIYPHAIHWEPIQRPQNIMKELGKIGYLCFFCENVKTPDETFYIEEKFENVYCINKEEVLVEAFKEYSVIIYMTWFGQYPYSSFFKNPYIWYDLVDNMTLFALSNAKEALKIHNYLIKNANLITYSAKSLKPKVSNKSVFIPNGVDINLFKLDQKNLNREGVVYVGAIDNKWFDWGSLIYAAKNLRHVNFDIYGNTPSKYPKLPPNIHLKGFIPQSEVPSVLSKAKVGIIPFKKNHITDYVLPLKVFEYSSMGLPTVAMGLKELSNLNKDFIQNSYDKKLFLINLQKMLKRKEDTSELVEFAKRFSWEISVSKIEEKIHSSIEGIRTLANICTNQTISVFTPTFFDFEGENYYAGGAERYLVDLYELSKSLGYTLRIFQKGTYNWMRKYKDIEVYGICSDHNNENLWDDVDYNKRFYSLNIGRSALAIYSPFSLSLPFTMPNSIGISHGVYWDNGLYNGNLDKWLCDATKGLKKMISVDTNTCNWFQTRDLKIGHKISYLPNYVDNKEFNPPKEKESKTIILYPRRLYAARGFNLVLSVIDKILSKFTDVEIHFVGRGFPEDTKKLDRYFKKWGTRVQWYSEDPEKMKDVYKKATITLIPTLYSEGTSLSCLEAMATGNIVIATRVGGLTNLIIHNYNGILIEPNKKSLYEALEKVLSNISLYSDMRTRAIDVANKFDKEYWNEKWANVMLEALKNKKTISVESLVTEIHLKKGERLEDYFQQVSQILLAGQLVNIYGDAGQVDKFASFGRLQFIENVKI